MANKKSNKFIPIIVIIIIAVLLIGGIATYFMLTVKPVAPTESESEDGSLRLGVTYYDINGDPMPSGIKQSLIGGLFPERFFATYTLETRNIGNVPLTNVRLSSSSVSLNENLLTNTQSFTTLAVTDTIFKVLIETNNTCTTNAQCDIKEACVGTILACKINLTKYEVGNAGIPNVVNFSTTLLAGFMDAFGVPATTPGASVALTQDIRAAKCTDNTPFLACSTVTLPLSCNRVVDSLVLQNNATVCGCPAGQQPSGNNCVPTTCTDGTSINTCSINFNAATRTKQFCLSNQSLQDRCFQCGGPAVGQGCQASFNGNPATACNPATNNTFSRCVYSDAGALGGQISQG